MISRRFPDRIGFANSVAISGMGLGQLVIIAALASVLVGLGWRPVFFWLGAINLALVAFVLLAIRSDPPPEASGEATATGPGLSVREAMRTGRFWLLLAIYAICGFQDFFVSTHVVAFASDQGVETFLAGNLLAFMGLAGLVGVLGAGAWSDRSGPARATLACFVLRAVLFLLILITKDTAAVAVFALLFGLTFWVTAPLTVVFVSQAFGGRNLGAISGLITMVHHICGGLGAWLGAAGFDAHGDYDLSFMVMAICAAAAVILSVGLTRPRPA